MFTEEIIMVTFRSNDDERLQIFDRVTSYPYNASLGKVCKTELVNYLNIK